MSTAQGILNLTRGMAHQAVIDFFAPLQSKVFWFVSGILTTLAMIYKPFQVSNIWGSYYSFMFEYGHYFLSVLVYGTLALAPAIVANKTQNAEWLVLYAASLLFAAFYT